jgi:phage head maturation protease
MSSVLEKDAPPRSLETASATRSVETLFHRKFTMRNPIDGYVTPTSELTINIPGKFHRYLRVQPDAFRADLDELLRPFDTQYRSNIS